MFLTSLTASAVAGLLAAVTPAAQPEWADSYGKALAASGERHQPVAVFLAPGGLAKLTADGDLGADALGTLKAKYVSVQVDTTTDGGKALAKSFGLSEGVVLSDGTGKVVALKHEGKVTPTELAGYLAKFADGKAATTTEVHTAGVPVAAPATAYQPYPGQMYGPTPGYAPGYQPYPGYGGCANGQCGRAMSPFGFSSFGGCANGQCGR